MKTREMRNMRRDSRLSVMVLTGLMIAASSHAAEKRISKSALPPAVAKTADEQSAGATVQGYMQDNDNGQVEYEVEMTVNGHSKDVTIEPSGQVLEVEEQVELSATAGRCCGGAERQSRPREDHEGRIDYEASGDCCV
jgi:hypothetical protein